MYIFLVIICAEFFDFFFLFGKNFQFQFWENFPIFLLKNFYIQVEKISASKLNSLAKCDESMLFSLYSERCSRPTFFVIYVPRSLLIFRSSDKSDADTIRLALSSLTRLINALGILSNSFFINSCKFRLYLCIISLLLPLVSVGAFVTHRDVTSISFPSISANFAINFCLIKSDN